MNKTKYPTLRVCLLTALLFFGNNILYAQDAGALNGDFSLSVGNLCEYVGKIQTNESGDKNFCSFLPALTATYDYYLTNSFAIAPQIGATLPKSGRDENINRMTMYALMNSKFKTTYLNFSAGLGYYITRISGPGGDEVLNNGNGSDSFPLPSEAVYSRNLIVTLGLGVDFSEKISGELYTYIFNIHHKEDRALSLGLNLSYHFGEIL